MNDGKTITMRNRTIRRKQKWIITVILLLVVGSAAAWFLLKNPASPFAMAASTTSTGINTETVRQGDIRITAAGSGKLVAGRTTDLSFSIPGPVVELKIGLGDYVEAGQILARVGNTESLEAEVANAELALIEAEQALQSIQENANLSLAQAYQDWITARMEFENAQAASIRTSLARCSQEVNTQYAATLNQAIENLARQEPGTQAWIDAKNDYDTDFANYNYCIQYTSDEKLEAGAALQIAENTVNLAEQHYNTLKEKSGVDPDELALAEARVNQAQSHLEQAKKDQAGIILTAPIDGRVTYLAAGEGSIVDTSTFLTISDTQNLAVEVQVDQADIDVFQPGSRVEIVFDAIPDQIFEGKLEEVAPQLTTAMNFTTLNGLARLDEDAVKKLTTYPLGLNATVTVVQSEARGVLVVPVEAIRDLGGNEYALFVLGEDGKLRLRTVEVGLMDVNYAEIRSGVKQGEMVSTGSYQTASQ